MAIRHHLDNSPVNPDYASTPGHMDASHLIAQGLGDGPGPAFIDAPGPESYNETEGE